MKISAILFLFSVALIGCGEPAPEAEKPAPKEQQVVMIPAQGGAQGGQTPTNTAPTAPVVNPTATPDSKAPGDREKQ